MNQNVKNLISWWILKAESERDPFILFFIYFLCLDAYITSESGLDNMRDKLNWFYDNSNYLKERWDEGARGRRQHISILKSLSPVEDMRPNNNNKVYLHNENEIKEVIEFIYQVRCNLFHGAKSPMDTRDKSLVDASSKVLKGWLIWAFRSSHAKNI